MVAELKFHNIPVFYIFVALCLILPRIPVVGKFFSIICTAIHEFGHALFTLILDGQVRKIKLNSDTSGVTESTNLKSKFAVFIVAIAGYPAATSAAWAAFSLLDIHLENAFIIGITFLFLIMLIFWIRNIYGIIWTVLFCSLNSYLIYSESSYLAYFALFYATMLLTESLFSALEQFKIVIKNPSASCDARNLANTTHIPAVIWALLFSGYAVWVCYLVIKSLLVAL